MPAPVKEFCDTSKSESAVSCAGDSKARMKSEAAAAVCIVDSEVVAKQQLAVPSNLMEWRCAVAPAGCS